jgi:arylsulfatase
MLAVTLLPPTALTANAQQTTGVPGSPGATKTIPGNQLPPPPQPFRGKIERNTAQSTPYWPARVVPPKGAPKCTVGGQAHARARLQV